ncbi:uncharacterized protein N7473_010547 [Penicillium subrubescens]|uniref:uncharacterized protein n=1 Tax=Penicillium subrubescens TaxID=1316194 RepID=UPI0025458013|nr:uncharacterized protein N7473_010547 [Penicillium subrubescens]KAJ5883661.1 hypothetical protein N7473_010547 [Penicillium subrubescens]
MPHDLHYENMIDQRSGYSQCLLARVPLYRASVHAANQIKRKLSDVSLHYQNELLLLATFGLQTASSQAHTQNTTYNNPILPGSTRILAAQSNNMFLCTTSSFLASPGRPIFASTDLKLGNFASTLRFRDGTFYLTTAWLNLDNSNVKVEIVLFTTTDPYDDSAWMRSF